MWFLVYLVAFHGLLIGICSSRELGSYNVDANAISVSGISSGACMATQLHVAYSASIMGLGTAAGVTYWCAEGGVQQSIECMNYDFSNPLYLASETERLASEGKIDNTNNLSGDKVFIIHGTEDGIVNPANANDLETYYQEFTSAFDIDQETSLNMVHGFPTEDYGTACDIPNTDLYLNRCFYHGAYEILNHIYGGLVRPSSSTNVMNGDFYEYEQGGYLTGQSMDSHGFIYVPSNCIDKQAVCKLHVHIHGCEHGRENAGDQYVRNTFFDHVGELNDIIILYPQVASSVGNTQGCWDWWGYTDSVGGAGDYVTRDAPQVKAIYDMIQTVISG